jgi:thiosulfate dehydrogenase
MSKWPWIILSFSLGLVLAPLAAFLYFTYGNPPVAAADRPLPLEARIVRVPLHARISREMPAQSPLALSDENLVAGARIYREQCASCHGLKDHPSKFGANMFPRTPQLWVPHKDKVVGVSDDPVGETFWKVKNGIRLSGMPSYKTLLSEDEMWQVSLLLSSADKPLPVQARVLVSNP